MEMNYIDKFVKDIFRFVTTGICCIIVFSGCATQNETKGLLNAAIAVHAVSKTIEETTTTALVIPVSVAYAMSKLAPYLDINKATTKPEEKTLIKEKRVKQSLFYKYSQLITYKERMNFLHELSKKSF